MSQQPPAPRCRWRDGSGRSAAASVQSREHGRRKAGRAGGLTSGKSLGPSGLPMPCLTNEGAGHAVLVQLPMIHLQCSEVQSLHRGNHHPGERTCNTTQFWVLSGSVSWRRKGHFTASSSPASSSYLFFRTCGSQSAEARRWEHGRDVWRAMCGGAKLGRQVHTLASPRFSC